MFLLIFSQDADGDEELNAVTDSLLPLMEEAMCKVFYITDCLIDWLLTCSHSLIPCTETDWLETGWLAN